MLTEPYPTGGVGVYRDDIPLLAHRILFFHFGHDNAVFSQNCPPSTLFDWITSICLIKSPGARFPCLSLIRRPLARGCCGKLSICARQVPSLVGYSVECLVGPCTVDSCRTKYLYSWWTSRDAFFSLPATCRPPVAIKGALKKWSTATCGQSAGHWKGEGRARCLHLWKGALAPLCFSRWPPCTLPSPMYKPLSTF